MAYTFNTALPGVYYDGELVKGLYYNGTLVWESNNSSESDEYTITFENADYRYGDYFLDIVLQTKNKSLYYYQIPPLPDTGWIISTTDWVNADTGDVLYRDNVINFDKDTTYVYENTDEMNIYSERWTMSLGYSYYEVENIEKMSYVLGAPIHEPSDPYENSMIFTCSTDADIEHYHSNFCAFLGVERGNCWNISPSNNLNINDSSYFKLVPEDVGEYEESWGIDDRLEGPYHIISKSGAVLRYNENIEFGVETESIDFYVNDYYNRWYLLPIDTLTVPALNHANLENFYAYAIIPAFWSYTASVALYIEKPILNPDLAYEHNGTEVHCADYDFEHINDEYELYEKYLIFIYTPV